MRSRLPLTLLAGALALGACDDLGTSADAEGTTRLSVLLTDAPGDFRAAVVTITDVYLQPGEGEDAARVYLLQDAEVTTDLLTLSNDFTTLVDGEAIPAGEYEQLRFVISGGYLEVEQADGGTVVYASSPDYEGLPAGAEVGGELQMPGFASSGLKVKLPGGSGDGEDGEVVLPEGEQTLLVDFDVSQSFGKAAGNSGRWVMRPTLKATAADNAGTVTVSLSLGSGVTLPVLDAVQLGLDDFSATLTPAAGGDAKVVAFTDADGDGVFEASFLYLFPGDYQVGLTGPAGITFQTGQTLPQTVSLEAGATATTALTLTSVGAE